MIKINADELNKFSVEVIKLSNEVEEDVKKVVKNSAFNIQKNAMSNLTKNNFIFNIINFNFINLLYIA